MHLQWNSKNAFSLIELIAVIAIVGVLAGIITPLLGKTRKQARQTACRSNLRQFGAALMVYRADHNEANPPWLSSLYPKYIDNLDTFICPSDKARGKGDIIPQEVINAGNTDFNGEVADNKSASSRSTQGQNPDVECNSYFYEFSAHDCSWSSGKTWCEAKERQLREGDDASDNKPYSASRMPIIRCWHHYAEGITAGRVNQGGRRGPISRNQMLTLNVAYAGNVFVAPPWWEGRLEPGEQ